MVTFPQSHLNGENATQFFLHLVGRVHPWHSGSTLDYRSIDDRFDRQIEFETKFTQYQFSFHLVSITAGWTQAGVDSKLMLDRCTEKLKSPQGDETE